MKKISALTLTGIMALSLLAGCGSAEEAASIRLQSSFRSRSCISAAPAERMFVVL